jgi:hypothetical protein
MPHPKWLTCKGDWHSDTKNLMPGTPGLNPWTLTVVA